MTADDSARESLRQAIVDLIRCRPEDWPEIVANQAGVACGLNTWALDLLADASVQVAATAHQFQNEADADGSL